MSRPRPHGVSDWWPNSGSAPRSVLSVYGSFIARRASGSVDAAAITSIIEAAVPPDTPPEKPRSTKLVSPSSPAPSASARL